MLVFALHLICYWGMVCLYDDPKDNPACFWASAWGALRNQVLVTLPSVWMGEIYPSHTAPLGVSAACIPLLIVATDLYFYVLHRCLHSQLLCEIPKRTNKQTMVVLEAEVVAALISLGGSFVMGVGAAAYKKGYLPGGANRRSNNDKTRTCLKEICPHGNPMHLCTTTHHLERKLSALGAFVVS
jgi:hypothetical protein